MSSKPDIEHQVYETRKVHKFRGQYHRDHGPAIEWMDGGKEWYKHGKLHRLDGPAILRKTGINQWWVEGKLLYVTGEAFLKPEIPIRNIYKHENVIQIVGPDESGCRSLPDKSHYIIIEESVSGYDYILDRPSKFTKILTKTDIVFIPNLPGI